VYKQPHTPFTVEPRVFSLITSYLFEVRKLRKRMCASKMDKKERERERERERDSIWLQSNKMNKPSFGKNILQVLENVKGLKFSTNVNKQKIEDKCETI
jgi:hypothetical protein